MLDTNIVILRAWIDPAELPDEMAISAITLAELSAGPHEVRRNDEQDRYDEHAERARRLEILQRVENEFDPVPFDAEAARIFGRVTAAVIATGRQPRGRVVDLMIASTAIAEGLPLYTTNPDDFTSPAGSSTTPGGRVWHLCHQDFRSAAERAPARKSHEGAWASCLGGHRA